MAINRGKYGYLIAFIATIFITMPAAYAGKSTGQSSSMIFIFDASGSMWGQIKGKPKITIAKEVMAKLIPELPDNARIGLIAYGHRRKGDCNDVETLVKLIGSSGSTAIRCDQRLKRGFWVVNDLRGG